MFALRYRPYYKPPDVNAYPGLRTCTVRFGLARDIDNATLISAAPEMLTALRSLKLRCLCDALNPRRDNRESDQPGMHWGSTPRIRLPHVPHALALAAIAKRRAGK